MTVRRQRRRMSNTSNSNPPVFCVVTPVFNGAGKIEKTIASVLQQDQSLFQFIVIDGGSTDGTVETLKAQPEFVNWISEPDRGIYDAMNKGIDRSTARFLYFLGAGDCLRPGVLSQLAGLMPDNELALLYGNVYWVDLGIVHDGPFTPMKFTRGCICHQSIFYGERIFQRLGKFDIRYKIAADWALNIKCFGDPCVEKIYIPDVIADYEGGGASTTNGDLAFFRDAPWLFLKHLGGWAFAAWIAERLTPRPVKSFRAMLMKAGRTVVKRLKAKT